jgi:hypothetical protein
MEKKNKPFAGMLGEGVDVQKVRDSHHSIDCLKKKSSIDQNGNEKRSESANNDFFSRRPKLLNRLEFVTLTTRFSQSGVLSTTLSMPFVNTLDIDCVMDIGWSAL